MFWSWSPNFLLVLDVVDLDAIVLLDRVALDGFALDICTEDIVVPDAPSFTICPTPLLHGVVHDPGTSSS